MSYIKNLAGEVMIPESEQNGYLSLSVYPSEAAYLAQKEAPTMEGEPFRTGIHVGTSIAEAKQAITSLDGMTLAEKEASVVKEVVVSALKANYSILPRTRSEKSDWE